MLIHQSTLNEINAYVLNWPLGKLSECPTPNEEQHLQIQKLISSVEECVEDIFKEMDKGHAFTLETNQYNQLFPLVLSEKEVLNWISTELKERGIEIKKSSFKVNYGPYGNTYYHLKR